VALIDYRRTTTSKRGMVSSCQKPQARRNEISLCCIPSIEADSFGSGSQSTERKEECDDEARYLPGRTQRVSERNCLIEFEQRIAQKEKEDYDLIPLL
jgi:hypothetical protein